MTTANLAENYRWWRDHGSEWSAEIKQRKRIRPYYFIQEVFLAAYMTLNSPARVLEFGCGFGRHLEYLSKIPGLEVYGYDQSAAMVEGIKAWASPEWMDHHISIGDPLAPLPYPDKSFDIVFTVSVLIHVRPEDLLLVLQELVRVAKRQIIHLENNLVAETGLSSTEHAGCWVHPLQKAYAQLGLQAEVLDKCYEMQDIYRIVLDPTHQPVEIGQQVAARLLQLDRTCGPLALDLQHKVDQLDQYVVELTADRDRLWQEVQRWHTEAQAKQQEAHDCQRSLAALTADQDRLRQANQLLVQQMRELQQSALWQIVQRLRTNALYQRMRPVAWRLYLLLGNARSVWKSK